MKQVKISQVLDITQPAVSQYISGNRGKTTELSEDIEKAIEEVSKEIYDLSESCKLSREKVDKVICDICKKV